MCRSIFAQYRYISAQISLVFSGVTMQKFAKFLYDVVHDHHCKCAHLDSDIAIRFWALVQIMLSCRRGYIYFACVNFFFIFFIFLLWAKLSQYLLDRFSRSFHQMEGICVNFLDPVQFFRFLKGRCHGNHFCGKITYPTCTYRSGIQKRNGLTPCIMCMIK